MKKKEETTEYSPEFYSTGNVRPPKNYWGITTLLLLLVIFLGGLVSALSFANVHLLRMLQTAEAEASVFLVADMDLEDTDTQDDTLVAELGFFGSLLTDFDRHYYDLPKGIYITDVLHGHKTPLSPGDILLSINGNPIGDFEALSALLKTYTPGDALSLGIYREGNRHSFTVSLTEQHP